MSIGLCKFCGHKVFHKTHRCFVKGETLIYDNDPSWLDALPEIVITAPLMLPGEAGFSQATQVMEEAPTVSDTDAGEGGSWDEGGESNR